MSTEISIRVPKVIATPAEFAEWEGYSRGSVYQMIHHGKLANYIEKKEKNKGRV
ncbi:Rha family transcriptional regulator, partial [Salmonella enterica]|nr:Rha family transcriptional regulator [Salmonella enterica]